MFWSSCPLTGFIDLTHDPNVMEWRVPGAPRTLQQRRLGPYGRYYSPSRRLKQMFCTASLQRQAPPAVPWRGNIRVTIFFFEIPARRRNLQPGDYCRNCSDVDNLWKFVFDAIQPTYIFNDIYFVDIRAVKKWAREGSTLIRLERV
jgi:Holliday junction resolvase RusA-like endonuclease